MPSIIENQHLKDKCRVFTPADIVTQMLDLASYTNKLYGKKVLENSCGNGEILLKIVSRYIQSCKTVHMSRKKIKAGLETDITAYELDENRIVECTAKLNEIAAKHKIADVNWDIRCEDFLKANVDSYDYIIGNPPYIAYPDLPNDVQDYVKNNFSTCKKGKFDYSYAFIEKSYRHLSNEGMLVYIVPSSIFKNVFAQEVRNLIKDDLTKIVDFPTESVFKGVLVSPAIICISKASNTSILSYDIGDKTRKIDKTSLIGKWKFNSIPNGSGKRIGDYFKVSSSIATLLNEAFVLKDAQKQGDYYCIQNHRIESEIVRKATSPKNKKYGNPCEHIIFPYYFKDEHLCRYESDQFENKFPNATEYLKTFSARLKKRDSDKNSQWYEYGRSQALNHMNQKKILISSVISECTKAYMLDKSEIPYSGLYIVPIGNIPLETLIPVLNSKEFKNYVNNIGVCVSGTSKRISPSDIENYTFDSPES